MSIQGSSECMLETKNKEEKKNESIMIMPQSHPRVESKKIRSLNPSAKHLGRRGLILHLQLHHSFRIPLTVQDQNRHKPWVPKDEISKER